MHLTEQTDQPKPTVFPKCRKSRNNGVNAILEYEKEGKERQQDVTVTARVLFRC